MFLSAVGAVSVITALETLMWEDLSDAKRRDLMEALPLPVSNKSEPCVLRSKCADLHVLAPGSRLSAVHALTRVLDGSVRGVAPGDDLCACYGGDRCPRHACEWRRGVAASERSFDASTVDLIACTRALVLDVGGPGRTAGGSVVRAKTADFVSLWDPDAAPPEEPEQQHGAPPEEPEQRRLDDGTLAVAGLDDVLATLETRVRLPLAAPPSLLAELGVQPIRGVIFHGPPGCGKTLVAKQVAEALCADVRVVAAPSLLDKYLGSSEERLRDLFFGGGGDDDALRCLVIDEIDAIATARSDGADSSSGADRARDSIVNQLLSLMDGVGASQRVLALATTNRIDLVDPALLRPGRFEVHVKVDPPDALGRQQILHLHTRAARASGRIRPDALDDLDRLAASLPDGTTGATIAAIVRFAASLALKRYFVNNDAAEAVIGLSDLHAAATQVLDTQLDAVAAHAATAHDGVLGSTPNSSATVVVR